MAKIIEFNKNVVNLSEEYYKTLLEDCIICGKQTDVPVSLHIDFRYGYVEGCGQCCKECYEKTK